jgi:hypothetical protein
MELALACNSAITSSTMGYFIKTEAACEMAALVCLTRNHSVEERGEIKLTEYLWLGLRAPSSFYNSMSV